MTEVEHEVSYRIGRGEVKYEVYQILNETREDLDPKIKELAFSLLQEIEEKIQKL